MSDSDVTPDTRDPVTPLTAEEAVNAAAIELTGDTWPGLYAALIRHGALDAARQPVGAEPDWLRLHADGPGHHYSLDDCRAALQAAPASIDPTLEKALTTILQAYGFTETADFLNALLTEYRRLSHGE